jgi:hypothetical protein
MPLKSITKKLAMATFAVAAAALAGCGADDIQLNGKMFDMVGLGATGSVKKGDPQMAVRQPLVVPPGLESLPPPGSGKAEQPTLADIQDPDAKQKVSQADLQRQQEEYCKVNYEQAKARGDDNADLAKGPAGPCKGSIFSAIKQWNSAPDDDSQ